MLVFQEECLCLIVNCSASHGKWGCLMENVGVRKTVLLRDGKCLHFMANVGV